MVFSPNQATTSNSWTNTPTVYTLTFVKSRNQLKMDQRMLLHPTKQGMPLQLQVRKHLLQNNLMVTN
jgi:hypothetical protein